MDWENGNTDTAALAGWQTARLGLAVGLNLKVYLTDAPISQQQPVFWQVGMRADQARDLAQALLGAADAVDATTPQSPSS